MAKETILITGASGFIGFASLIAALKSSFHVRAILRDSAQIPKLKRGMTRALPPNSDLANNVDFAIVSDLTVEGAFDEVMEGVGYIFHVANPMQTKPSEDYEKDYLYPSIRMSTNIFDAAKKAGGTKRIVVLSSVSAVINVDHFVNGTLKKEPFTANDPLPQYEEGRIYASPLLAYAASKTRALDAAEHWIKDNKPSFDVVFLLPCLVLGASYLSEKESDVYNNTNGTMISFLRGHEAPFASLSNTVSVDDLAEIMAKSITLRATVPSGRYLVATTENVWDDAKEIVKAKFPKEIESGKLSLEGKLEAMDWKADSGNLEKVYGIQMKGFERVVVEVVTHYLTLDV